MAVPQKKSTRESKLLNNLGVSTHSNGLPISTSSSTPPFGLRTAGLMGLLNNKPKSNNQNRLAALKQKSGPATAGSHLVPHSEVSAKVNGKPQLSDSKSNISFQPNSSKSSEKLYCKPHLSDPERLYALETKSPLNASKISNKLDPKPRLSDPKNDFVLEFKSPLNSSKSSSSLQTRFNKLVNLSQSDCTVTNSKISVKHNSSPKTTIDLIKSTTNTSSSAVPAPDKGSKILPLNNLDAELKVSTIGTQNETTVLNEELKRSTSLASNKSYSKTPLSRAKIKALAYIKQKGGINKIDPQGSGQKGKGVKRFLHNEDETISPPNDVNHNVFSERFIELMKMESSHRDLVKLEEYKQEMQYYDNMEKKEQMQEKMMTTFHLECKLVRCLRCKYTWFSASDACKADGHPLKLFTGLKRFFKCNSCSNRTVAVTFLPLIPCSKCGETRWERAPMMKEKIVHNGMELSLRGGEEKFINSVGNNMNLNLLMPD